MNMNTPKEEYYNMDDHPDEQEISALWSTVRRHLPDRDESVTIHWRSFWIGQAAAIVLILALVGAWSLWDTLEADTKPDNELQVTYTNTLRELASANPVLNAPQTEQKQEALNDQLKGLEEIDRIINEIRNDILINGSTKAKRNQLRRLYATKLEFVQKFLLNEEESI